MTLYVSEKSKFMTPEKSPYQFKAEMLPKMELKLKLSQQQIQNLELLLLPALELTERINQELEQNPTLEISDEAESTPTDEASAESREGNEHSSNRDSEQTRQLTNPEQPSADANSPDNVAEILDRERDYTFRKNYRGMGDIKDAKIEAMQNTPDRPESLQDYLYFQFLLIDLPESTRIIGKDIIYNIDDDGFLKTPLVDIAGTNGVALEAAEKVLGIIQRLDPPGMGSQNLAEYLLMQLSEDDRNFELKRLLITQYFDQLQEYKLPNLAKLLDKSLEEIQKAAEEIKLLKPHPAAGFSSENIPYIFPDVIITKIEDNYEIKVQSEAFPSLVISQYYRQLMAEKNTDKPTRIFVRDKINDAAGLIQAILLRGSLLRQVAEQIVLRQRDFLDKGIEHLKPLMMKDIAKNLGAHGVHLSTVSRILANKYVQTPHGLYSMKFFFSSTSETAQGNVYAQPAMISAIKEIVEKEDKEHPLSDVRIAQALKGKNFTVSRRTIAKYRETLNIPNHNQRKKSE